MDTSGSRWAYPTDVIGQRRIHKIDGTERILVAAMQQDKEVGAYDERHYDRNKLQHPSQASSIALRKFSLLEWHTLAPYVQEHDVAMPLFAADLIDSAEPGVDAPSYLKFRCRRCAAQLINKVRLITRIEESSVGGLDNSKLSMVLEMIRAWFIGTEVVIPDIFRENLGDCVPRIKCHKHDCKNFVFAKTAEAGGDCGFHK